MDPQSEVGTSKGAKLHDGFYFRAGLGMAGLIGTYGVEEGGTVGSDIDASGLAVATELAFGGSPTPGLAIGGGIYSSTVPTTTHSQDGFEVDGETSAFTLIGGFIDAYPDPKQGFHIQGAIGLGAASSGGYDSGSTDDVAGFGWGLMGGLGYEAFVSNQWSIGAVARVLYINASMEPSDSTAGNFNVNTSAVLPGVLFSVTCH